MCAAVRRTSAQARRVPRTMSVSMTCSSRTIRMVRHVGNTLTNFSPTSCLESAKRAHIMSSLACGRVAGGGWGVGGGEGEGGVVGALRGVKTHGGC